MLDDYTAHIANGRVHVLERGGAVQGIRVLIPQDDAMLLDNIAVARSAQHQGLERRMVEFAEHATHKASYKIIKLYTNEAMVENLDLYRHVGYIETHRVEEKGLRRVYMLKCLSP